MAATICPTITADTAVVYRDQMQQIADYAVRIHIDLSDGILSPRKLVPLDTVWWPGGIRADLHVMMQRPFAHVDAYRALGPQLVIVHAEASGNFVDFATTMHAHGIEVGVALLQGTPVATIQPALDFIDHVMIFSGHLGHFGGQADLGLLSKVQQLKALKPAVEIGWDGGVTLENARQLKAAGVDVLNVGGAIHKSQNPHKMYDALTDA